MSSVPHSARQYDHTRAAVSHQPARHHERPMRLLSSVPQAHAFLTVPGLVLHLLRVGRHLRRVVHHRLLPTRACRLWHEVTYAC